MFECLPVFSVAQETTCCKMQVSFYRSNLFLKVLPKAKGKNEEGNDIQLEAMIDYIWYLLMPCPSDTTWQTEQDHNF